jgi:transcriptional regulator with XRE-family HTH domain
MAIKAHLDHQAPADRNSPSGPLRSAERRGLRLETSGFHAGLGETNVTIHNISAAGLLIETSAALAEGEQLAIDLPEAGTVAATVVWQSERLYGCAFDAELGPAALAAAQLQGFAPGVPNQTLPHTPVQTFASAEGLGVRLNRLRREAGLTLADIAEALGVSKPTVWAWEKGKARPLPERLEAIASVLGVAPDLLAAAPAPREIDAVIADCRHRIAQACGTTPEAVRIMIEL